MDRKITRHSVAVTFPSPPAYPTSSTLLAVLFAQMLASIKRHEIQSATSAWTG